jgi:acetolactate synthase-1/2/3 large subunit
MPGLDHPRTGAEMLVRRLRDHGVRHVFGYPGGQLTPIYDALYREPAIRHILARDEQAAAFMADGYARATGRPGVCFAVCGPGVYNAATPLATAYTDSVPMVLISGQIATSGLGLRSGFYHENDQLSAMATLTKWRTRIEHPAPLLRPRLPTRNLGRSLDDAFSKATSLRPGPVLVEVPLDVQRAECGGQPLPPLTRPTPPPEPRPEDFDALTRLLDTWRKPLLMAGGGVINSGAETPLAQLAERLGAPVFTTFMGKCALSSEHPLKVGLPWSRATSDLTDMRPFISPLFTEADGLLAIGCRFTQATTASWALKPPALAQIDIDPAEIGRHYPVALGIQADAGQALRGLLKALPAKSRTPWAPPAPAREPWRLPGLDLLPPLRQSLPRDAIVVADITRLAYIMLAEFPVYQPRTFLHPAGFVAMGYGIPAALGAKAALPERTVVTVVGDGCFLMCGMELATAVQEKLPIVIVLINDSSLTLIKALQQRRFDSRYIGVDLLNPDFGQFARAFGVRCWQVTSEEAFARALREAIASGETALVEVQLPRPLAT